VEERSIKDTNPERVERKDAIGLPPSGVVSFQDCHHGLTPMAINVFPFGEVKPKAIHVFPLRGSKSAVEQLIWRL